MGGDAAMRNQVRAVVSRHTAVFTSPPMQTPADVAVDGPLLGNGDIGTAVGGDPGHLRLFLSKNDFWRLIGRYGSSPKVAGVIDLSFPSLAQATWRVEQRLWDATTTVRFGMPTGVVNMCLWVAATANVLMVEIEAESEGAEFTVSIDTLGEDCADHEDGVSPAAREMVKSYTRDVATPTAVACAVSVDGAHRATGRVVPGMRSTVVVGMASRFAGESFREDARTLAGEVDAERLRSLRAAHEEWWAQYWEKSWVELDDPVIEQRYYLSHYIMGSCCRDHAFPPAIFGTWTTTNSPCWAGDYHLNYNFQAPFYALYSSNRLEQASVYHAPVLAFMPRGQWYAREVWRCRGVHYPVGIGPRGDETTLDWPQSTYSTPEQYERGGLFYGQKSNAAYCAANMAFHWYHTYDDDYANEVYPFVREVASFWEDYLRFENGRYVIHGDSVHEGSGQNVNPILSLGLVRMVMALALDISRTTGVDAGRREQWQHILDHLSAYPIDEKDGKTIFRLSEAGYAWHHDNTLAIQHIYPAGGLGLDSDPTLLAVARQTIDALGRWRDFNGMNSLYPAAVRVGYDSGTVLRQLREMIEAIGLPNGFIRGNPHGIEHCSTVPNTVNEMLLQSHEGVLRLFPAWPAGRSARFRNLRARGAFLVSAAREGCNTGPVLIRSEKGRPCIVENPWPNRSVRLVRDEMPSEVLSGSRLAFPTHPTERLVLEPLEDGVPPSVAESVRQC